VAHATGLDGVTSSVAVAVAWAMRDLALAALSSKPILARANTFLTAVTIPGAVFYWAVAGGTSITPKWSVTEACSFVALPMTRAT